MDEPNLPREPLSHVDAAWLRMDSPENPMTITALLTFDRPLMLATLADVLEERLLTHARFAQRVVPARLPFLRPRWAPDPEFDLCHHLHRVEIHGPDPAAALDALVGELMSTPLDPARPLWQVHLVERYQGGAAAIVRVHHAVGDGVALVRLLLGLTEATEEAKPPVVGVSLSRAADLWQLCRDRLGDLATLGRLLLLPAEEGSPLRAPLGRRKVAACSPPVPLAEIKHLAAEASGKVNDVLAAAVAGALRHHLRGRATLERDLVIRALVPVYVQRDGADPKTLGNHFGLVFLPLPVGIDDPLERLQATKRAMDRIKCSSEALVALAVLDLTGATSSEVERVVVNAFTRKASLLMTNVPGPRTRVRLAGRELTSLMFWAPTSGRLGLSVSVLSYGGEVRLGASGDARLLPNPHELTEAFIGELAALRRALEERRIAAGLPADAGPAVVVTPRRSTRSHERDSAA